MRVIGTMAVFGFITYGSLAGCLVAVIVNGIRKGQWELAIVTSLISTVASGASAAAGFMAGVLSQTFKQPAGTPNDPLTITNPPGERVKVEEKTSTDETAAPQIEGYAPGLNNSNE